MAEVSNDLIYEVLKQIQFRLDKMEAGIAEIRQELTSIRLNMLGMQNDIHNIDSVLARHEERFDRMERRLELRELAEPPAPYRPA